MADVQMENGREGVSGSLSSPAPSLQDPTPEEEPPSLGRRFLRKRTLLSFGLGFGMLLFLVSRLGVEVDAIWARISQAQMGYYLLALALYYMTFPVRGLRWRRLLRNVGFNAQEGVKLPSLPRIATIILLSWFANCVVPAKLGDAYRAYLLKRQIGVSFSKTVGTILAERIIDTLLLFGLLAGAALLAFRGALPSEVVGIMQIGLGLAVVVALGLLAMRNLGGLIKRVVPGRFQRAYGLLEEGTLGSFGALPTVLLYSIMAWLIEAGRLYLVGLSLGLFQLSVPVVLFVALAAALLTTVPVTPAGLGFVETGIVGLLLLAAHMGLAPGLDQNMATSLAILDRTISYWSLIVFGLIVYLVTRGSAVSRQPLASAAQRDPSSGT